jgi:hypothetical protein
MNAVIGALDTHTAMSTQALGSETVRGGIKGAVLGQAQLHQSLRWQAFDEPPACGVERDALGRVSRTPPNRKYSFLAIGECCDEG